MNAISKLKYKHYLINCSRINCGRNCQVKKIVEEQKNFFFEVSRLLMKVFFSFKTWCWQGNIQLKFPIPLVNDTNICVYEIRLFEEANCLLNKIIFKIKTFSPSCDIKIKNALIVTAVKKVVTRLLSLIWFP